MKSYENIKEFQEFIFKYHSLLDSLYFHVPFQLV